MAHSRDTPSPLTIWRYFKLARAWRTAGLANSWPTCPGCRFGAELTFDYTVIRRGSRVRRAGLNGLIQTPLPPLAGRLLL